ncbi:hypothetical protein C2E21_7456 [Chlorella sorokiniana]|uniref:Uncharacterized protein n=1 Tax=Chlorella sorokiniana TaxID=3076 RepID=A0A2P6TIG4_CHLSO|nr:hypothetical protein C2E21_7456 [Chlorella sorokiniana]|eukprot:PRW34082.1 hypothetical protein C2E21_7456 [Chlorella sorokiniana]
MAASVPRDNIVPGFLLERLQAAKAIPASERTPEVAAFIESCQLRDEAAAMQAQPLPSGAAAAAQEKQRRLRQVALRLVRADMLCAGAPLDEYNGAHQSVVDVFKGTLAGLTDANLGLPPGSDQHSRIIAFGWRTAEEGDLSPGICLDCLLLITAGLPPPPVTQQVPLLLLLLKMVTRSAARAALEPLLLEAQSGLPAPLLTWDQLTGRLVEHAAHCCMFAFELAGLGRQLAFSGSLLKETMQ